MKKMEKNNTGTHVLSTAESIRACPTAAIKLAFRYFLDEDVQKNTVNLLWGW